MGSMGSAGSYGCRYDFDRIVERRGTDSMKWGRYGADVLPLWVADMDFPSPKPVIDALRRRVDHGIFGYGVEPPELRPLVQARLKRRYSWEVDPDDMIFLPGVFVGFNLVGAAFGETGDGILIQTPVYPPFHAIGKNVGRTMQSAPLVRTDSGYEIDFDIFERAITRCTRVFLLCNPHNPVGRVFTRTELEKLAEICIEHDLIICADEIHQDFIYEGHTHIPIASLGSEVAARTVTLISPSKSFNIAGFHFSIAIATNPEVRKRLVAAAAGRVPNRPGIFDFVAGLAAYEHGDEWFEQLLKYLQANRDFLVKYVRDELPQIAMFQPEGTYLGWLDCRAAGIAGSPTEHFLKEAKVALQDGALFGSDGEGFARLNFGCPRATLVEAMARIKKSLTII